MKTEKGLPSNFDAERMVLGGILIAPEYLDQVVGIIEANDFSLEKHRRIFKRACEIHSRGEHVDRITVANELMMYNELESVDGLSYLVSLDEGMPQVPNIESYARIVKEKATLRNAIFAAQHLINRAMLQEETASEILGAAEKTIQEISNSLTGTKLSYFTPMEIIERYPEGLSGFLSPTHEMGIPSGFDKFDEYTYGLRRGKTIIIAAKSSHGKTTFMGNVSCNAASKDFPVLYISLEMNKESILHRLVCSQAQVSFKRMIQGLCGPMEREKLLFAMNKILSWPLYIDDASSMTILQCRRKIEKAVKEKGVRLVVVDYLQRMAWASDKDFSFGGSAYAAMSTYSTLFKDIANSLGIPIMIGCQMSRKDKKNKDQRPELRDLRDSGRIEEDADIVAAPYYEWRDKMDQEHLRDRAEMILLKQRDGAIGTIPLIFKYSYGLFLEDHSAPLFDAD